MRATKLRRIVPATRNQRILTAQGPTPKTKKEVMAIIKQFLKPRESSRGGSSFSIIRIILSYFWMTRFPMGNSLTKRKPTHSFVLSIKSNYGNMIHYHQKCKLHKKKGKTLKDTTTVPSIECKSPKTLKTEKKLVWQDTTTELSIEYKR